MLFADNTPPFSTRRARVCAAGVSLKPANKSLAAFSNKGCAKRGKRRRQSEERQAAVGESQRDSDAKPRVGVQRLPWVLVHYENNTKGVVANWDSNGFG